MMVIKIMNAKLFTLPRSSLVGLVASYRHMGRPNVFVHSIVTP